MIIKTPAAKPSVILPLLSAVPAGTFVMVRLNKRPDGTNGSAGEVLYGVLLKWYSANYLGTIDGRLVLTSDLDLIEVLPNSFVQVVE